MPFYTSVKPNIHIGYAYIPNNLSFDLERLSTNQRQYFDLKIANASDKRKRQFYASRVLLNTLSAYHLSSFNLSADEPLSFPYRLLNNKKSSKENHYFNISHSDNWVCVAIAESSIKADIGVDIQILKTNWSIQKARFFCSEAQLEQGFKSQQAEHYFTQLWSCKEAYFKASQKAFTNKEFDNDGYLSKQALNEFDRPVFISLYCADSYRVNFQQWCWSKHQRLSLTV